MMRVRCSQFAALLAEVGRVKVKDTRVRKLFAGLSPTQRKLVMVHGTMGGFLQTSERFCVVDNVVALR